jgi:excisionase family DNA binding protein
MTRLTYTVEEAAELLGISRGSAYAAAKRGDFPTIRLNRRVLVPRAAFEQFLGATMPAGSAHSDTPTSLAATS